MRKLLTSMALSLLIWGPVAALPLTTQTVAEAHQKIETVIVENAHEFLMAVASNRKIILKPNLYNLSQAMHQVNNPHIEVRDDYLFFRNLKNLTIVGEDVRATKVVVESSFSTVFGFEDSQNIRVESLELGHATPSDAICLGSVLGAFNSKNLYFVDLNLFGSGSFGLWAENSEQIQIKNSIIKESTSGLMWLYNVKNLKVSESIFVDNRGGVNITGKSDVIAFEDNQFVHNNALDIEYYANALFQVSDSAAHVKIEGNRIAYNKALMLYQGLLKNVAARHNLVEKNIWTEAK